MNDRFKFRTYLPDLKFFKYWGWVKDSHYIGLCPSGDYSMPELLEKYTTQCIGLKDKNDKLIYEGDIVKVGKWDLAARDSFRDDEYIEKIGVVNYYQPRCRFLVNYTEKASPLEVSLPESCLGILGDCHIEVIGNIYENPELLED